MRSWPQRFSRWNKGSNTGSVQFLILHKHIIVLEWQNKQISESRELFRCPVPIWNVLPAARLLFLKNANFFFIYCCTSLIQMGQFALKQRNKTATIPWNLLFTLQLIIRVLIQAKLSGTPANVVCERWPSWPFEAQVVHGYGSTERESSMSFRKVISLAAVQP